MLTQTLKPILLLNIQMKQNCNMETGIADFPFGVKPITKTNRNLI